MNQLRFEIDRLGITHGKLRKDLDLNQVVMSSLVSGYALRTLTALCNALELPGDPLDYLREGTLVFECEQQK